LPLVIFQQRIICERRLIMLHVVTGTPYVSLPFNNHGTVTINGGTLQLTGGVSLANGTPIFGITNTSVLARSTCQAALH
jgi:hypothetical protein